MTQPVFSTLPDYTHALKDRDWRISFYSSPDKRPWRSNREELAALKAAQPNLDPDFRIWNTYAPEHFQVHLVGRSA